MQLHIFHLPFFHPLSVFPRRDVEVYAQGVISFPEKFQLVVPRPGKRHAVVVHLLVESRCGITVPAGIILGHRHGNNRGVSFCRTGTDRDAQKVFMGEVVQRIPRHPHRVTAILGFRRFQYHLVLSRYAYRQRHHPTQKMNTIYCFHYKYIVLFNGE